MTHRALTPRDRGRYDEALRLAEEGLTVARDSGDLAVIGSATFRFALVMQEHGEFDKAQTAYAESLERFRAVGDRRMAAYALLGLGAVSRDIGDFSMVEAYCSQSLQMSREVGHTWGIGYSLNSLGLAVAARGDFHRAHELFAEALDLFGKHGVRAGVVEALVFSGQVEVDQGHPSSALPLLHKALRQAWPDGPHYLVATVLEEVARVLVAAGQARESALLSAAALAWRGHMGAPVPPYRWPGVDTTVAAALEVLGEEAFATVWKEGRELTPERAVLLALAKEG